MSKNEENNLRQDRRQWLKNSATILGASLLPLPDTLAEMPQAGRPPEGKSVAPGSFFTSSQHRLVEELAETMIPADSHSGGAKAAKVADFIEQTVRGSSDDSDRTLWREGLRLIDSMSQHYNGKPFVDAGSDERIAVLTVLSDNEKLIDLVEVRFFNELKRLTVAGYYTSKIGIHDELEYKGNRILMEFVGCDDPTPKSS